jgi:hypothetical protein
VTQNGAASRTPGTPPVIQINGDNAAIIHVGDTYADLGAVVTDSQGHSLSYRTFVNAILESQIVIDTSSQATDTIDYVAMDSTGLTSTSTRAVPIEAAAIPAPAGDPASSTEATSTTQ